MKAILSKFCFSLLIVMERDLERPTEPSCLDDYRISKIFFYSKGLLIEFRTERRCQTTFE